MLGFDHEFLGNDIAFDSSPEEGFLEKSNALFGGFSQFEGKDSLPPVLVKQEPLDHEENVKDPFSFSQMVTSTSNPSALSSDYSLFFDGFYSSTESLEEEETFLVPEKSRFCLTQQPADKQRKSYQKERRYILPNPLTIMAVKSEEELGAITKGSVFVELLEEGIGGATTPAPPTMLGGNKHKSLDFEKKCQFSLFLMEMSDKQYKLRFTVSYIFVSLDHTETLYREVIFSDSFEVKANIKRQKVAEGEHGLIRAIQPKKGQAGEELWIHGRGFLSGTDLAVTVGPKMASVYSVEDNFIVCTIPNIPELSQKECSIPIVVSFLHQLHGRIRSNAVPFVYIKAPQKQS